MFQRLGIMSRLIGRRRIAVYDPEKEAFFLWQNTFFSFRAAERRMRDGSLAKNKPSCRDVNQTTLLIRNCWIVLKSDLKLSADSNLVDSFMEFSTGSRGTLQFFFLSFLFWKKRCQQFPSPVKWTLFFFVKVTLRAAMMNNQLDTWVHEILPEATIKRLFFSLPSLSSFGLTGTYCQRGPAWGCERCFFELYGSICSHQLFIMLVPGISPP